MEWFVSGVVVESAVPSQRRLDLTFSLVNDSIHNEVYTCRVTRGGGMTVMQNFTANVYGEILHNASSN